MNGSAGAVTMERNFKLQDTYKGFGIYNGNTLEGNPINNDWLITNEDVTIIFYYFMDYNKKEVMDAIDNYADIGKFGLRVIPYESNTYVVHNDGQLNI